MSFTFVKKKFKILSLLVVSIILLAYKYCLQLKVPITNTDGPWSLSSMVSFMKGDFNSSVFSHDYLGEVFTVHFFQWICSPFFLVFGLSVSNFFLFNIILIGVATIVSLYAIKMYKSPFPIYVVFLPLLLLNPYLYSFRPEILGVIIGLLLIVVNVNLYGKVKYISFGVLLSMSLLIHPAAFIGNGLLVLVILFSCDLVIKNYILMVVFFVISLILLSEGNFVEFFSEIYLNSNELSNHSFNYMLFLKYGKYNAVLIFVFYVFFRYNKYKFLYLVFSSLIISLVGRSYYFSYLIPIILYLLLMDPIKIKRYETYLLFVLILFNLGITHVLPTYIHLENNAYGQTMKEVLNKTNSYISNKNEIVWVPSQLGMEAMNYDNSRMYFHFYEIMSLKKIDLNDEGKLLLYKKKDLNSILKNLAHSKEEIEIVNLIAPVKGKYTISSGLRKRTDSIGLWEISLNSNFHGIE